VKWYREIPECVPLVLFSLIKIDWKQLLASLWCSNSRNLRADHSQVWWYLWFTARYVYNKFSRRKFLTSCCKALCGKITMLFTRISRTIWNWNCLQRSGTRLASPEFMQDLALMYDTSLEMNELSEMVRDRSTSLGKADNLINRCAQRLQVDEIIQERNHWRLWTRGMLRVVKLVSNI